MKTNTISIEFQNNIISTLESVKKSFDERKVSTMEKLRADPLSFLVSHGLSDQLKERVNRSNSIRLGIRNSVRAAVNRMVGLGKRALDTFFSDCSQCELLVLFILWLLRAILNNGTEFYPGFEDAVVQILSNPGVSLILGGPIVFGWTAEKIRDITRIDPRIWKIAQYICYLLGVCNHPIEGTPNPKWI